MKKLIGLGMIIVFLFCGCISFEVGNTEKELVAKIAARHVGFEVQKRYLDIAVELLELSKEVLDEKENEPIATITNGMISALTNKTINDPLLAMDIKDLIGLIKIKTDVKITETQMKVIKVIARGLIEGIETGGDYEK